MLVGVLILLWNKYFLGLILVFSVVTQMVILLLLQLLPCLLLLHILCLMFSAWCCYTFEVFSL